MAYTTIDPMLADLSTRRTPDADWSNLTLGQQIRHIEVEGYLVRPGMLDANLLKRLKGQTAAFATRAVSYSDKQRGNREVQWTGGAVTGLIAHPPMIKFLKALFGQEIVMMGYDYARSEPGHPGISLHSDGQPWGSKIFGFEHSCPRLIRCLYYLDDLTPEISPFRVVPRSHLSFHNEGNPYLRYERHPEEVMVTAKAGDAVLINQNVIHRNYPNIGTSDREMLAIAYRPSWAGPASKIQNWPAEKVAQCPSEVQVLMGDRNQRNWAFDAVDKPDNMPVNAPGMKIESIKIVRVALPLIYPFRTAYGNDYVIESILIRLSNGSNQGWGEGTCFTVPAYCSECAATQFIISRDIIAPLLLNQEIASGIMLQDKLKGIKGNYFAKGAFDLAWWDLYSREQNQPLWKILGGRSPVVEVGADFGAMDSIADLINAISEVNSLGYKRVKLKYRPGWDLDMIKAVRSEFPDTIFHIDCNSAYSLDDLEMFKELDNYSLAMIEQPLAHDDLIDHAALQSQLKTPICLDESITSLDKVRKAINIGACRWVNIKPGRVGGITNALEIHNHCEKKQIPCWVGGMLESAIGASHCIALATLSNIKYPSDIFPSSRFYKQDLTILPIEHSAPSQLKASGNPGIGVKPDEEMLNKFTLEKIEL